MLPPALREAPSKPADRQLARTARRATPDSSALPAETLRPTMRSGRDPGASSGAHAPTPAPPRRPGPAWPQPEGLPRSAATRRVERSLSDTCDPPGDEGDDIASAASFQSAFSPESLRESPTAGAM